MTEIPPVSSGVLEVRHFLRFAGLGIATFALVGGATAYMWARQYRNRPTDPNSRVGAAFSRFQLHANQARDDQKKPGIFGLVFAWALAFTFMNVAFFLVTGLYIGGDAGAGRAEGGHFFVSSHGHITEVSETIYSYSLWQGRVVGISLAACLGLGLVNAYFNRYPDKSSPRGLS